MGRAWAPEVAGAEVALARDRHARGLRPERARSSSPRARRHGHALRRRRSPGDVPRRGDPRRRDARTCAAATRCSSRHRARSRASASRDGRSGSMKQHGFARNRAWSVLAADRAREVDARARLRRRDTRAVPVGLRGSAPLRAARGTHAHRRDAHRRTAGDAPMPFALGFHPYFDVPDAEKANARIATDARRAWDNVAKPTIALEGPIDLTREGGRPPPHRPHAAQRARSSEASIGRGVSAIPSSAAG